jgi:Uma2 family endonuclease
MEAKSKRQRWTYAEFARLPTSGSTRYEIIDDELVVTPAPSLGHQRIVSELIYRLVGFAREHGLGQAFPGPVDVLFAEGDYLEPDVVFVRADRSDVLSDRGIEGPPDLVVEIVSPSTAARDRGVKLERYRHYGVPEYWIADADARSVEVWRIVEGFDAPTVLETDDTLRWTPVEGGPTLEIDLAELFATGRSGTE